MKQETNEQRLVRMQHAIINAQIELLLDMAEHDMELSTDQVAWINDDLDFIGVAYFRSEPDGDRQDYFLEEINRGVSQYISFPEAMDLLSTRIKNSL